MTSDDSVPAGRRWHDMGGLVAALPVELRDRRIDPETHDYALWEKRVDALMVLTSAKGLLTVDGLRRALEDMGPNSFESMSYYERWIASVTQNLIEAGAFSLAELREKMVEIETRGGTYGEAANADKPTGGGS